MRNTNFIKLLFVAFIATTTIFTSCKKDEPEVEPPAKKCYLTKALTYDKDNKLFYSETYNYDSNNKLKEMLGTYENETNKVAVEYDSDNKVVKISSYDKDGVIQSYQTFEYNSKNQIIKSIRYYSSEKGIEKQGWNTYEYDSNGNITKSSYYDKDGNNTSYTKMEYDSNGNITRETNYRVESGNSTRSSESTLTYDDKNNPYATLNFPKAIMGGQGSKNNIKTGESKSFDESGAVINTRSNSYTYEYDDKGYPTKQESSDSESYTKYEYTWK